MSSTHTFNKLFGIGLSKTGTTSLGLALKQLGIRTIDFPHDLTTLHELEQANFQLSILKKYDAVTDTPVVPYYPQLDALYPGSKFILTVRDKPGWLKSIRNHWDERWEWLDVNEPQRRFTYFINTAVYGTVAFHEQRFSYLYDRHVREVTDYFKDRPDDLLVLNVCAGEGWDKLCPFLGLPVPDQPFPRANTSTDRARTSAWICQLKQMHAILDHALPAGATLAWADECQLLDLKPRDVRPSQTFPERDGVYQGRPADDADAIDALRRQREQGAQFISFIGETMWWLDHYAGFRDHLEANYRRCVDEPFLRVYDLRH